MGKYVLGISRSEVASKIFINACNEFQFLNGVRAARADIQGEYAESEENGDEAALVKLLESIR